MNGEALYDEIQQQAKEPQLVDVVVPVSRIEMTFELDGDKKTPLATLPRYVLADEEGHYPIGKLLGWEVKVLDTELARDSTVAWYRNPSSPTKDSVQIPWHAASDPGARCNPTSCSSRRRETARSRCRHC